MRGIRVSRLLIGRINRRYLSFRRCDVSSWQIVLQKSKIERCRKSRESRSLDTSTLQGSVAPMRRSVVSFVRNNCGPSYGHIRTASAVLGNFIHHPKRTFATISAHSVISLRCGTWSLSGAGSTDRCNTLCELVCWGLIEQGLSGSLVELSSDGAELGLAVQGQIGSAWKILAQQSVGVFV